MTRPQTTAHCVPIDQLSDTALLASRLAQLVIDSPPQSLVVALSGTLGSGKTQWARYFCHHLGVPEEEVTSPTYVLLHQYRGLRKIQHLDLYRLQSEAEAWDLGLDELYELPQIVLIEWADRFPQCLPDDRLSLHFELRPAAADQAGGRLATLTASGAFPCRLLDALRS